MNKKGIVTLSGIILMVVGLTGALFLDYSQADIISLVTAFVGAGMVFYTLVNSKEHRTWLDYVFLGMIALGSVLFVFGGFDKDTTLAIVGALVTVIGAVLYIIFGKKKIELKDKEA